jgi:4'-phosphopantetheinyl transferase
VRENKSIYLGILMVPHLTLWEDPPSKILLAKSQVHLWRFRLDLPATDLVALKKLLSRNEQVRAERLLDPVKSNRFVAARGCLRQVLARYLDSSPADVTFAYGAHGKPRLEEASDDDLMFNLSHAGDWGLLVVAQDVDVGVDVEKIDHRLDYEKVAARVFSPDEMAHLEQCHAARRRRGFYRIWTRKEAMLKGQGFGFSAPEKARQSAGWLIRSFTVGRGCLGAVAVAGHVTQVRRWHLG